MFPVFSSCQWLFQRTVLTGELVSPPLDLSSIQMAPQWETLLEDFQVGQRESELINLGSESPSTLSEEHGVTSFR